MIHIFCQMSKNIYLDLLLVKFIDFAKPSGKTCLEETR